MALLATVASVPRAARAQANGDAPEEQSSRRTVRFLGGVTAALAAHELGHITADVAYGVDPGFGAVDFHGIPFFSITHRAGLPPHQELVISSAGFWVQHASSEWILSRHPRLREERSPALKGVLSFNVLTSIGYAGAAFARTGPSARDTRGIALAAGVAEPWVGLMVLTPALLDALRYRRPETPHVAWAARVSKLAFMALLLR